MSRRKRKHDGKDQSASNKEQKIQVAGEINVVCDITPRINHSYISITYSDTRVPYATKLYMNMTSTHSPTHVYAIYEYPTRVYDLHT